jgi:hypothetical protein
MCKGARAWVVPMVVAVALVPVGIAFGLSRTTTVPGTRASCLDWAVVTSPSTTGSTAWKNVPGMRVRDVLAQNIAVQVSGTFEGSDLQLRVLDTSIGGTSALAPGKTSVHGDQAPGSVSFTWVGQNPAEHQHTFQLQWRSPSGGDVTMSAGDVTLLYQGAPTPASC